MSFAKNRKELNEILEQFKGYAKLLTENEIFLPGLKIAMNDILLLQKTKLGAKFADKDIPNAIYQACEADEFAFTKDLDEDIALILSLRAQGTLIVAIYWSIKTEDTIISHKKNCNDENLIVFNKNLCEIYDFIYNCLQKYNASEKKFPGCTEDLINHLNNDITFMAYVNDLSNKKDMAKKYVAYNNQGTSKWRANNINLDELIIRINNTLFIFELDLKELTTELFNIENSNLSIYDKTIALIKLKENHYSNLNLSYQDIEALCTIDLSDYNEENSFFFLVKILKKINSIVEINQPTANDRTTSNPITPPSAFPTPKQKETNYIEKNKSQKIKFDCEVTENPEESEKYGPEGEPEPSMYFKK